MEGVVAVGEETEGLFDPGEDGSATLEDAVDVQDNAEGVLKEEIRERRRGRTHSEERRPSARYVGPGQPHSD